MKEKIDKIFEDIKQLNAKDLNELEQIRIYYLGKKGVLNALFDEFKTLPPEEKKIYGKQLNDLKNQLQNFINTKKEELESKSQTPTSKIDFTRPAQLFHSSSLHPISIVRNRIINIFARIGYDVAEDIEIEDDWHNFTALNFPPDHPARDMQDTFFIEKNPDIVLRTHTSSVQIRLMEKQKPPIRYIFPGRVYRNEAISSRSHVFFHQIEGLYVDNNVSFADLKDTLEYLAQSLFDKDTKIRLRPSYFPFTEPSAEMDISCNLCGGRGCSFCKNTGWVEILGCGMVHPNVLKNCGIDPNEYSGFAFGLGIERITNLLFSVNDLRLFSENDVKFLHQFSVLD